MLVFCFKDASHRAASGTYILPPAYTARLFCFHIRIVFRHPARLARSTVVTLLKHPVKELLIEKERIGQQEFEALFEQNDETIEEM